MPVTSAHIAAPCLEAAAALFNVQVRDPATGRDAHGLGLYAEVLERLRGAGGGVVLNLTAGIGGGELVLEDPRGLCFPRPPTWQGPPSD